MSDGDDSYNKAVALLESTDSPQMATTEAQLRATMAIGWALLSVVDKLDDLVERQPKSPPLWFGKPERPRPERPRP